MARRQKTQLLGDTVASVTSLPALRAVRRKGMTSARRLPVEAGRPAVRQQNVYLTDEETRALKMQAAYERRSMSAIVSDALRAYLAAHPMDKG
jgi:hypothetical protein